MSLKSQFKNLDAFQIGGFTISLVIAIGLLITGYDTLPSIILGIVL